MMQNKCLKRGCDETDTIIKKQRLEVDHTPRTEVLDSAKNVKTGTKNLDCESDNDLLIDECSELIPVEEEETTNRTFLREENVGISEYISQHKGFSGVVKQRYSDFIVNERNLDGSLVELSDMSLPEMYESVNDIFPPNIEEKLHNLIESKDEKTIVEIEVGDDKEYRTKIHQTVRKLFPGLESSTQELDGKKIIKVKLAKKNDRKQRKAWPAQKGNYCHFVLYKENKDTMEAINVIAKKLGMKHGAFTYAGTKDKRAKTSQKVSVYRVEPAKLKHLNEQLIDIRIGNFNFAKEALKLGDLSGNHFKIILRNLKGNDDLINQALNSLKENGFINYYGMQRFGTTSIPTHHVGKALLNSLWSEAIDLILKPRTGENASHSEWRKFWQASKNAKETLEKLPRRCSIEFLLLQGLLRHGNNLQGALSFIPRNSRMLYVHSYQSFIWNTIVSRRLKKYGLDPIEGDLVAVNEKMVCEGNIPVKTLEVADLTNYTLHDVILPLPGYDVIYPKNEVGEWYKELLAEDNIKFDSKNKNKDYSLPGAYRKIIVRPDHLSWSILHYNDFTQSLILSDLDKLNGLPEPESVDDPQFKALKLEFSLQSSCYATMLIREIFKEDTSSNYQCSLNQV